MIHDYGCEVILDESAPTDQRVVKALVDGARLSQIFRNHPMYFFHNCRKITDLHGHICSWRENGEEYNPSEYVDYKKPRRIKRQKTE